MADTNTISVGDSTLTEDYGSIITDNSVTSVSVTKVSEDNTIAAASVNSSNLNTVSLISIKNTIANTVSNFENTLINDQEYEYSQDKFTTTATKLVDKAISESYKKLSNDASQKAEIDEYKTSEIAAGYTQYIADVGVQSVVNPAVKQSIQIVKAYDYDPVVENNGNPITSTNLDKVDAYIVTKERQILKNGVVTESYPDKQKLMSAYQATNNSYSGADMVCQINFTLNSGYTIHATLGTLQTISYSIYQNKTPVRVLGNMNAKDWVFGPRTIAGSLVFAVFNKHWLVDLYEDLYDKAEMKGWHFIADEIPPFDITISFANEYGFDSKMVIYGVRLMNEGQTMSTNDIYIENTYQFVANDINLMDTLTGWNKNESKIHSATGSISVQTAKYTSAVRNTYSPKTKTTTETTSTEALHTQLMNEMKKALTYTEAKWNQQVLDSDLDIDAAKKAAKAALETSYDKYKNNGNLVANEDQKLIKTYYNTACDYVDKLYKQTKAGNIIITPTESDAPHGEGIKTVMQMYNSSTYNKYLASATTDEEKKAAQIQYIDNYLERITEYVDAGTTYNQKDLTYAKNLHDELVKKINGES